MSAKILTPEEWLPDEWRQENPHGNECCLRAVHCLEHISRRDFAENAPAVLEIGPFITPDWSCFRPNHRAPISVFSARHPEASCLATGHWPVPEGKGEQILGDVQYLREIIFSYREEVSELIRNTMGRSPDIVYGQHVFEDSPEDGRSLPYGPYNVFEQAAGMLKAGGYIVVDNYGGREYQIGRQTDDVWWPHSAAMQFAYSYMYQKDEGIYVFRKDDRVVVPRPVWTRKKKKGKD